MSAKLLRSIPGHLCHFQNDGTTTVLQGDSLTKFTKSYKTEWVLPLSFPHHQLKTGTFTGNYLILDSAVSKRGKLSFRSDVLKVVSPEGKVLKSVNFRHVLRQLHQRNFRVLPFHPARWMHNSDHSDTNYFEDSHVNSLYEYFEMRGEKREFAGYIVNCYYQKKIIVLDKDLATVVQVIDTGTRAVHDVQMFEPGKIIFYQNYASLKKPRHSSLVEYDLITGQFTELYSARSYEFSSKACGSFQHLGERRFMLAHSNCIHHESTFIPVLEFIDLRNLNREIVRFAPGHSMSSADTADLSGYFKNNAGP